MNIRKLGIVLLLVILSIFLTAYFMFNVSFVRKSTVNEGLGFESLEESASIRNELDKRGISYSVREKENGVEVLWDKKEVNIEERENQTRVNLLPSNKTGLCFPVTSDQGADSLIELLSSNSIEHFVSKNESDVCVDWSKEDDIVVRELYPNLEQIRVHQEQLKEATPKTNR